MMELFQTDVTGQPLNNRRLMPRRNYVAMVAYDPSHMQAGVQPPQPSNGRLSLAADFMVQGEGSYGNVVKFGPVVVPPLDIGR